MLLIIMSEYSHFSTFRLIYTLNLRYCIFFFFFFFFLREVEKSSQALHETMIRKSSFRKGRRPRARTLGCAGFDAGAFQSETAPSIAYRAKKPPLTYAGILVCVI